MTPSDRRRRRPQSCDWHADELAIFDWDGTYSLSLWSTTVQVEVEVDCPYEDPKTVLYRPMNAPEGTVTWAWSLKRGQ